MVYETGEDIDRLSRRAAIGERHENHFVAAQGFAVPGSMLSDKSTAAIRLGERASDVESQPERSGMIAERVIGDDRLGNRIRLRRDPRIHMLSVIAVRPPIEAAILHLRQVIRHEIAAEL